MKNEAETTMRNRVWRALSGGVIRRNIGALLRVFQSAFVSCSGKPSVVVAETKSCAGSDPGLGNNSGYLNNAELAERLTELENRVKRQNKLLEKNGLKTHKVPSCPTKPARRYYGDIEPDLSAVPQCGPRSETQLDPLDQLLDKVKPARYDDEKFDELESLVQTLIMTRVHRGAQGASAGSVKTEGLYIC